MARFLLFGLAPIFLVFSAEITKASSQGNQPRILIQPEQNPQNRILQERSESDQNPANQEKRFALVIGNGAYAVANPLRNPANDALAMSAALREIGFDVIEGEFYFIPTNSALALASSNHSSHAGGRADNSPTASGAGALKNSPNTAANPDSNSTPPPINPDRTRDSIQRKFDGGLSDDAILEALDYLESQPNDPQVNWLLGHCYIKKELFPGGFRYISKAVDGGMPVIFDIRESSFGLLSFSAKQGTLKVQKDGLEIQLDKTTTRIPYNLVREISAVSELATHIHLKVGVNQNNKIKEKAFKLFVLYFHNYPLSAGAMAKAINPAIQEAWARSVVNFIGDVKTKAQ